jgi:hypothetical protein
VAGTTARTTARAAVCLGSRPNFVGCAPLFIFNQQNQKGCKGEMIAHTSRTWPVLKSNLMHAELPQESHVQCTACNLPLRLVAVLAPALGEQGHRIFQCDACGHHVWVKEPPLRRTDVQ